MRTSLPMAALVILALAASAARAQDAAYSADTTVSLSGTTFDDDDPVADDLAGTTAPMPLGPLPPAADLNAYHLFFADNDQLYALDTSADLGGGLTVSPADVVRFDNFSNTLEFDGSAAGIPPGVQLDAVSGVEGSADLLLSFDTTVDLGGGLVASDEDLVSWDGASFAMVFDGSAEGVAAGLDLDGAYLAPASGFLLLSFDGSGVVGGVPFDDEDVLEFDASGPTWSLAVDGSAAQPALAASDLDAVPEPGQLLQLASGIALLAALARRRAS